MNFPQPLFKLLCLAVLLVGLGACEREESSSTASAATDGQKPATTLVKTTTSPPTTLQPKTNVAVLTLTPQAITVRKTYVGTLEPFERIEVSSESEGVLEKVPFEEGDTVREGQLLAYISHREKKVQLELAQANLNLAQSNYDRDLKLYEKKLIPPAQLDQTSTALESARLQVSLWKIELDRATVTSPIYGVIKSKLVSQGEYISKGEPITEILQMHRMKAVIPVPESDITSFQKGDKVSATFYALGDQAFEGIVHQIPLEADSGNRTFPVEILINNPDNKLLSGMLGRVDFELGNYQSQLVVPRHAILEREEGKAVYLAKGDRAHLTMINTGSSVGTQVRVLAGLKFGDQVIIKGQEQILDQDLIEIKESSQQ